MEKKTLKTAPRAAAGRLNSCLASAMLLAFASTAAMPVSAVEIRGPAAIYIEKKSPALATDIDVSIDFEGENPAISAETGTINPKAGGGILQTPVKPSNSGHKNPVTGKMVYTWGYDPKDPNKRYSEKDDLWSVGVTFITNNKMKDVDAYWTKDGVPMVNQAKIPVPGWKVVAKDANGKDPLSFTLSNPYAESLVVSDLNFLLPTGNIPLTLDALSQSFSSSLGTLIGAGSFSLAPQGTSGSEMEFLFDGGLLPLLDIGATLDAEFSANFQGMAPTEAAVVRIQHATVPEPSSILMLVTGLAGLWLRSRRESRIKNQNPNLDPALA